MSHRQPTNPSPTALLLPKSQRDAVLRAVAEGDVLAGRFYAALRSRVHRRAASPGLIGHDDDAAWWYPSAEYLTDAAMVYTLEPDSSLGGWLRDTALTIARRPLGDWIGPWFRDHSATPPIGHLETAHLCWGLGIALLLAPDAFSDDREEIVAALGNKGLVLCRRWLEANHHLANWRAVMTAGVAVAAAASGQSEPLAYAAEQTHLCAEAFQADGSYAESLQYGSYLAYALMTVGEVIGRVAPALQPSPPEILARMIPWMARSFLYTKPLSGWDHQPRARSVNFGDCAATFRPSGDLLLHVAARCRESLPVEAGLARWLFEATYAAVPDQKPHNLATFGLRNDWGYLTLPLLLESADPLSPEAAGLAPAAGFDNGHVLVRASWQSQSVLAAQTGTQPLCGPGHLHGDVNSFQLVHRNERLLVDPGHSCYRNLIHGLESASQTHNTCTFLVAEDALGLQEDLAKSALLEQKSVAGRRVIVDGRVGPAAPGRGRRLLLKQTGRLTTIVSEAADVYGPPIDEFLRCWLLYEEHVLLVVDRIRASRPVRTMWNWLLNNRDGSSALDVPGGDRFEFRRGLAGLKLWHTAGGRFRGPIYGYLHDAYHPEPNQLGEGRPGSGLLCRWIESESRTERLTVHALAFDDVGRLDRWQVECVKRNDNAAAITISSDSRLVGGSNEGCRLEVHSDAPLHLVLRSGSGADTWQLCEREGRFSLETISND